MQVQQTVERMVERLCLAFCFRTDCHRGGSMPRGCSPRDIIGWVMTPTLTLLLEREAQIRAFHSTPFYTVQLDCGMLTAASERRNSDSWIH